jgi:hypothetical protein
MPFSPEKNTLGKIERIGKNREKLLALEKEGEYVFHGSTDSYDILEPKQAHHYSEATEEEREDKKPAVFASTLTDVAIFRALINEKAFPGDSQSKISFNDGTLTLFATKNLIENAKKITGMVYVLDKQQFKNFEGMQCWLEKKLNQSKV